MSTNCTTKELKSTFRKRMTRRFKDQNNIKLLPCDKHYFMNLP